MHPFHFAGFRLALAHKGDLARMRDMKPGLMRHIRPEIAQMICGTTDSEWLYALIASQLADPRGDVEAVELVRAVDRTIAIIREIRARLDIATSSSVNLFITTGTQIAACATASILAATAPRTRRGCTKRTSTS
ncbi:MAG: hypothetical protein HY322_11195 [Betaproteobacteria bacterium]|nr:hypothetical protein [Betaproteobacteria bacterium]